MAAGVINTTRPSMMLKDVSGPPLGRAPAKVGDIKCIYDCEARQQQGTTESGRTKRSEDTIVKIGREKLKKSCSKSL